MTSNDSVVQQCPTEDMHLVEALKSGDESAFEELVSQFYAQMLRVAMIYVSDSRLAEEVVQETWIGVLRGLGRFEGRSSLKTWIFSILMNRAKTLAQREGRYIHFAEFADPGESEPAVPAERFEAPGNSEWVNHWISVPRNWNEIPEEKLISSETLSYVNKIIDTLPLGQRDVITLRDVEGWSSADVCNVLGVSETNQRVLLHRARSKVRRALEDYLEMLE